MPALPYFNWILHLASITHILSMFVMLLWEYIHITSSIKMPVHSGDGTCNLWSANWATVQGQVGTEYSSLEYFDVEWTKHSFEVPSQLNVKAYMESIGLVIQRMGVPSPLWSCKLFSLSSVLCTWTLKVLVLTSQTLYSPDPMHTPIHFILYEESPHLFLLTSSLFENIII